MSSTDTGKLVLNQCSQCEVVTNAEMYEHECIKCGDKRENMCLICMNEFYGSNSLCDVCFSADLTANLYFNNKKLNEDRRKMVTLIRKCKDVITKLGDEKELLLKRINEFGCESCKAKLESIS